jgi:REP element-mobilizing transposase RayT
MANTYTQLYIQIVFAVQGRQSLILKQHKDELYKYITGIVQGEERGHKLLAINGMPDHIHLFVGLNPKQALSDLVRDVKASSSGFIKEKKWLAGKFSWQEGYGAFSYSRSDITNVIKYIAHQEEHHSRRTFKQEYLALLEEFNIQYDNRYVFKWIEDGSANE